MYCTYMYIHILYLHTCIVYTYVHDICLCIFIYTRRSASYISPQHLLLKVLYIASSSLPGLSSAQGDEVRTSAPGPSRVSGRRRSALGRLWRGSGP